MRSIRGEVYEFGAALGVVDPGADITAVPVRPPNSSVDEGTAAASGRGLFIVDSLAGHVARILQGAVGIPETGGMYRVAIEDVSAWTMGDFSYSDH
ncbi:hypothetical protein GCM10017744_078600 [Streptomyces antimycoticus]|uniref:Uncharacterized protein n=1 Tax=Streptomyces antimycoticus TaxID=68175 RepID=A0A4D4K511_9ACTN|nr:hypothetical protein SANT12839_022810 [Streptomyces antimycoticus]